jgi:hypothetical protein
MLGPNFFIIEVEVKKVREKYFQIIYSSQTLKSKVKVFLHEFFNRLLFLITRILSYDNSSAM